MEFGEIRNSELWTDPPIAFFIMLVGAYGILVILRRVRDGKYGVSVEKSTVVCAFDTGILQVISHIIGFGGIGL